MRTKVQNYIYLHAILCKFVPKLIIEITKPYYD